MKDGELIAIGSGSSGNAYILKAGDDVLLLELGCKYENIVNALEYRIDNVAGALISHTHGDHLSKRTCKKMAERGIKVYGTRCDVMEREEYRPFLTHLLYPKMVNHIGNFSVMPLKVPHGTDCFAFVIDHPNIGRCLFATDMSDFPYVVKDIRHLFIEANYSEAYVMDNASRGEMRSQPDKHMEIGHTINVAKRLIANTEGGDSLMTCVLLHMSQGNGNPVEFKQRIIKEVPLHEDKVFVAEKNLCVYLQKDEY